MQAQTIQSHTAAVDLAQRLSDFVSLVQVEEATQAALAAEEAQRAAQQAVRAPVVVPRTYQAPSTPVPSAGSAGSCTGFSIPDYIIQRESGGDPNAVNPSSGAYGCSQTLPAHYQPGPLPVYGVHVEAGTRSAWLVMSWQRLAASVRAT